MLFLIVDKKINAGFWEECRRNWCTLQGDESPYSHPLDHSGNMMFRKLTTPELNRKSVEEFRSSEKIPVIVVLDNVRSMNNVGSIFRTTDAFLMQAIFLCGYTPCPPHRDIQKTALGATDTVHWEYHPNILTALEGLKQEGYKICAVEQAEGSVMLQDWKLSPEEKWVLILGNEVEGVQDEVITRCDQCVEIPQSGMKHSLNISVAAGIVLWELYRNYR